MQQRTAREPEILLFILCHRAPEMVAACLGSLEANICKVEFKLQSEKKCKLLLSVSALPQIVQSQAALPLQLNCTAPKKCCGFVLSLSLLPCSSCCALSPSASCQYPLLPSHDVSYPTELISLVELYLLTGQAWKRMPPQTPDHISQLNFMKN